MNRFFPLLFLAFFIFSSSAVAANKVVVVPLGGAKHYMYWQGQWSVDTSYKIGDGIQQNGSSYVCVEAHQSTFPDSPPSVYWNLLASKGADGTDGAPGADGLDGATGAVGAPGAPGAPGATGATGAEGADGIDGIDGVSGVDGNDGATGPQGPAGSVGQAKGLSIGNEVTRTIGTTHYTWLDRNLGAIQVATSFDDSLAYGDLYQWGRGADGHENRTSPPTTVLSSSDAPKHDNFILVSDYPNDWRSPQEGNLWQGVNGINNPCPAGFRLPTETEWETERTAWVTEDNNENNSAGAFASPLKLVVAGYRDSPTGTVEFAGIHGFYWSATVEGVSSRHLEIVSNGGAVYTVYRAKGNSVRCLKD